MKKIIALVGLLAAFLVFLFLVYLPGGRQEELSFAFFVYDKSDTFIQEMTSHMIASLPENVSYETFDAGNSQSVQNRQIVEAIDGGFDIFIINTVDRLAAGTIVERLCREDIPIIFFNREPLEEDIVGRHNVFYVGAATDVQGTRQADIAVGHFFGTGLKRAGDTVGLVILKGEHGHQDAEIRTASSLERLNEHGLYPEILAIESANWRRADARQIMSGIYARHGGQIDLILSNNDDMALGAIDFLLEESVFIQGEDVPFIIIGVDGTPVGLQAVYDGFIYGTVLNDIEQQTDAILTLADYIVHGRDMGSFPFAITNGHFIYIYGDIVTRDIIYKHISQ